MNSDCGASRLAVMNYLNEVAGDYPSAISFASGRPAERFFDPQVWIDAIPFYLQEFCREKSVSAKQAAFDLAQYGRTSGLINDLIAGQVRRDEGIECYSGRIVVTAGCQEALALCIHALCPRPNDVVLARNPTYIGVTGVADLAGVPLVAVNTESGEDEVQALDRTLRTVIADGRQPRALYLIPEFDNPTGSVLTRAEREAILELCARHRVVILEDSPYGMFRFEGERDATLATLDRVGSVIYLGTYSKTLCPAVRVGFAVLPETLFGDAQASRDLAADIAQRKSFLTVNTSQLNQALVGGVLMRESLSLERIVEPARQFYASNRDVLRDALDDAFGSEEGVSWNVPTGGFFLSLHLPFEFGVPEMTQCARDYQVIAMPMSFFSLDGSRRNCARIAFSNVEPDQIRAGVDRLSTYFKRSLARSS